MRGSVAPARCTSCAVSSVEPSSTTRISWSAQSRSATAVADLIARSMFVSSLNAGSTMERRYSMVRPRNLGPSGQTGALGAQPDEVEPVVGRLEACGRRDLVERGADRPFELGRHGEVVHLAAAG